jgi:hypothetical protein
MSLKYCDPPSLEFALDTFSKVVSGRKFKSRGSRKLGLNIRSIRSAKPASSYEETGLPPTVDIPEPFTGFKAISNLSYALPVGLMPCKAVYAPTPAKKGLVAGVVADLNVDDKPALGMPFSKDCPISRRVNGSCADAN